LSSATSVSVLSEEKGVQPSPAPTTKIPHANENRPIPSAIGSIAGVVIQQNGCDYHQSETDPNLASLLATNVAPNDFEAGLQVAMFVAACAAANTPGALISVANGNVANNGTSSVVINGSTTVNCPLVTGGDSGGKYNAGHILAFHPSSPPTLTTTGTFNMSTGGVTAASTVFSVPAAVSGLYLTAFKYLGFDVAGAAAVMTTGGINNPMGLMLI
jgi:hypothetical protein